MAYLANSVISLWAKTRAKMMELNLHKIWWMHEREDECQSASQYMTDVSNHYMSTYRLKTVAVSRMDSFTPS